MSANNPKKRLAKATANFESTGSQDVRLFYNRVLRIATNAEEGLFPPKKHARDEAVYHTEKEYDDSFKAMVEFQKQFTEAQKKSFDVVMYHTGNLDGAMSAYIYWDYVTEGGDKEKDVTYIGTRPDFGKGGVSFKVKSALPKIQGKNVLMVDLAYNKETYEAIAEAAKFLVIIDDHPDPSMQGFPNYFAADKHATTGVVFKFFHPDKPVPYVLQYVDSLDGKLALPWLAETNAFATSMYVRFVKNQKMQHVYGQDITKMFKDMQELFAGPMAQGVNFMVVLGQIMSRFRENMKMEISNQATKTRFSGYPAYILNYSQPGMTKLIAKNIASQHQDAKFAVLWHYDHRRRQFDITLSNDHNSSKPGQIDMGALAKKISREFPKSSGGGHKFSGHLTIPGAPGVLAKLLR